MGGERFLIIKLGALGDMVQATTFFQALRRAKPKAHLTLLTTKPYVPFAETLGLFDAIWVDTRPKLHRIKALINLRQRIISSAFDGVIDLQNVDRTALYRRLLWPHSLPWHALPRGQGKHPQRQWPYLLERISPGAPLPLLDLRFMGTHSCIEPSWGPYVLLIPGASNAHGGAKRWPEVHFAELAKHLHAKGFTPVIIGGPGDSFPLIHRACPQVMDLCGHTTFFDVIGLGSRARLTVGNDTGPTLLAASGGSPTLTFYSRFNPPDIGGPLGLHHRPLQTNNLATLSFEHVWGAVETMLT
jgi:ADP-heptose:LPS heptosyltransferase